MINGFKWIGLIIATMVGAGYASGEKFGSSLVLVAVWPLFYLRLLLSLVVM